MMDSTEIVPSIPRYLVEQLDVIAKNHQFLVYTIHVDNCSKHEDKFKTTVVSVTLRGQQYHNGVKVSYKLPLICKFLPDNITRRKTVTSTVAFEREVYFYGTILPFFMQFLEEKHINVDDDFSIYPRCFVAVFEPKFDHHLIVTEDLKSLGYDLWDKAKPIDFDATAKVLMELGKFHAISFAMHDQRKEIVDKMFRIPEPFVEMFRGDGAAETMITSNIQQTIDALDDEKEIEVMQKVRDNYKIWLKEYLNVDAAGRFTVLNHGVLWNNNMMFKLESSHQHPKLRFVDLPLLRLTSPVIDISYFLCTSTNSDIHQRYNDLLHVYYNALATFLTKLGSDPKRLFTFNDLEEQFLQFCKYGLIFAPMLVSVMLSDSNDTIDMDPIKHGTKADGHVKLNEKTKILYKERMSSVIQLAIKSGWV